MVRFAIGSARVVLALILLAGSSKSEPARATGQPLTIATRLGEPEAFLENGEQVGFSIDIGRHLLEEMGQGAVVQTYPDVDQVLNAIRSGKADIGIAAIPVTLERLNEFDFSHPFLSGDLQ